MSSRTSTRHETVLNVKQYSARGSTRCEAARLEAMFSTRRLLGWRRCSLRGGSAGTMQFTSGGLKTVITICMSIAASVSYTNTIHYILQEVRFTEPELFKHMMSQFIAEFGHHLLSAKRRRTQQIARLTPMMPNEAELMSFGKILENNMTVGQCKLPLMDPVSSSNPDFRSVDGAAVEPKTLQDANFLKGSVKDFINRLEAEPTMREQKGSKHVRNSGCGRKKLVPCYF
ncbi:hypothetical protein ACFX1Q_038830 [Malus domestica]